MRRRTLLASAGMLAIAADVRAAGILAPGQFLRGRFVQERHLRGFDAPLRTEGTFILVPRRGLIWRAETPFAITTVITASGLTQEVAGTETIRLTAASLPFLNRVYVMLDGALSDDWTSIRADFGVIRSGTNTAWDARMTPNDTGGGARLVRAITLSGGRFVDRVLIEKPNGDTDEIRFLDQTVSATRLRPQDEAALASAIR